jgi:hypothetical protein
VAADAVTAPPDRPPEAVFELVARYEAGRRRARDAADGRPTDDDPSPEEEEER